GVTMSMDIHPPSMPELPRGSADSLRVRCPHCRKLYLVQVADIQEARPRFECIECHTQFWLSMAEVDFRSEVIGWPVHLRQPPRKPEPKTVGTTAELSPCPKCFRPNPSDAEE